MCFRVVCLLSKSRTRPCVSQIGNFILCVKICTPPILMSLLPPPVLIAGLYNCTDDWAPQTVWQATTTQHTRMSGSLNFTQFLILLWMIKEACPIITHEKLTQPSVWTNWGSFVCFAVSQSRNLMFSPLRLGSFFLISWPVLPLAEVGDQWLAFSSTYDLPYPCSQQMLVQCLVCVILTDCTDSRGNSAQ